MISYGDILPTVRIYIDNKTLCVILVCALLLCDDREKVVEKSAWCMSCFRSISLTLTVCFMVTYDERFSSIDLVTVANSHAQYSKIWMHKCFFYKYFLSFMYSIIKYIIFCCAFIGNL